MNYRPPAGDGIAIATTSVIHGSVPALARRVDLDDRSIVFSGDTNGDNGNLQKLASGADVFIAHNAIPEGADRPPRALHMPPSVIGAIAKSTNVHRLVVSHRMLRHWGTKRKHRASSHETMQAQWLSRMIWIAFDELGAGGRRWYAKSAAWRRYSRARGPV